MSTSKGKFFALGKVLDNISRSRGTQEVEDLTLTSTAAVE